MLPLLNFERTNVSWRSRCSGVNESIKSLVNEKSEARRDERPAGDAAAQTRRATTAVRT